MRAPRLPHLIALLTTVVALGAAAPALAYDSGPHADMTEDAMAKEGFGVDAIDVARVNNWFVDFYENGKKNPFSGHGGFWKRLAAGAIRTEGWSKAVMDAADRSHFDSATTTLFNTEGVTGEWDRLRRAVWTLAREARDENDPAKLIAVLGMSLHQVQDFYTHTNWIEPANALGAEGPDWQARNFGSSPTWFDIPQAERDKVTIYTANTQGHSRQHGEWNSDGNFDLTKTMAKDWPGRPLFLQSAITAYFASRQWLEAVRLWVDDDAFWARAQRYRANQRQLDHDLKGAFNISLYGGHWQGQGEPLGGVRGPGGSLISLRQAIKSYFQPKFGAIIGRLRGRTEYRARFEKLITRMADPNAEGELGPLPSSQPLQRSERIVILQVLKMRSVGFGGLGDPGPDDADMYANVRIDGQPMSSAVIHGHDSYSFPKPNAPFTWIKAVPAVPDEGEPVESIEVEVKTGNVRLAGTDDDVYVTLGRNLRFPLDKRLYNDFERGDRDNYSVPIDAAVRAGMRVGDITRVGIEKSRDGIAGGWRLAGVKVRVNGRLLYDNQHVDRWLEGGKRTWIAGDFRPVAPRGTKIPVTLRLWEDDFLYGDDDEGDINPFDRRRTVAVGYTPGTLLQRETTGGGRLGGRLDDGDEASIVYRLGTIRPEPMHVQTPPPPPGHPDLVITSFFPGSVTVKNQGDGPAGPFRLKAGNQMSTTYQSFGGLAAGQSETRELDLPGCYYSYVATVDDLGQVAETDETNNSKDSEQQVC
jgi:hypothetical protein